MKTINRERKFIFWSLCAVLFLLPLPYGGVEEWTIAAFEVATLFLFVIHLVRGGKSRDWPHVPDFPQSRASVIWKLPLTIFFAISILQLVPFPYSLLKYLSPQSYEVYRGFEKTGLAELAGSAWKTLSFSPNFSLYELIKYICFGLFGYLILKYVRTKKNIEIFVLVMMAAALFQAVYGLAEYFGGTGTIFGWKNTYDADSAFGTFVNRDHFSGFLEMIFPLSVGYLLAKADFFEMKKGLTLKEKFLWFCRERMQRTLVFGTLSVLMAIGVFFSRSRSGVLIFFAVIFLMITAASSGSKKKEGRSLGGARFRKVIRTVFIVVVFSVAFIGIKPIIERFTKESLARETRPVYYKNTIELIKNYPLLGTGLGTYVYAYPLFEKLYDPGILRHAHNDYLEVLAESGVIGGGSLILLAFGAFGYLLVRWMRRRDYFVKGIVLGCMAGIAAILIHSVTDFCLRIPANAVYFIALYAVGIRTVTTKRELSQTNQFQA